jgi:hypothetical protein
LNDIKLPLRYWNSWSRSTPPPWSNFSPFEYHLRMKKTNWRSLRVRKELRLSDLLFIFSPLSKPVRRDTCNFDRSHLVCCALMSVNVSELQWDGLPQSSLPSMVRTSGHRSDHKEQRWTGVISDSPFLIWSVSWNDRLTHILFDMTLMVGDLEWLNNIAGPPWEFTIDEWRGLEKFLFGDEVVVFGGVFDLEGELERFQCRFQRWVIYGRSF